MTWFLCVNPASGDSVLLFYAAAIEVIGLQINLMIWNFVFWDEMVVLTMHILYGYIYMHWYDFDIMSWTNHWELEWYFYMHWSEYFEIEVNTVHFILV
jgi:hypothetical protein